jgi:hypothetical protein
MGNKLLLNITDQIALLQWQLTLMHTEIEKQEHDGGIEIEGGGTNTY